MGWNFSDKFPLTNLDMAIRVQENVVRLDISVNDVLAVKVLETLARLDMKIRKGRKTNDRVSKLALGTLD